MLGAEVVGFGLPPAIDPSGIPCRLDTFSDCRILDVRDAAAVSTYVRDRRPEIVFHLAAQPLVRRSYADPLETFTTNVLGTAHVLDASVRSQCVLAVVNVTTDKCYENREWPWAYREDEPLGGHDPYSASKACSEIVTAAYRKSFALAPRNLFIASGRAGNVFGGGDWSQDRLIPDIARAIIGRQPVQLRRPEATRPWQHVVEALSGYLTLGAALLASHHRFASAYNFGPFDHETVDVLTLARQVVAHWGKGQVVCQPDPNGPHEAHQLKLDISKARSELNWEPLLTMQERIAWTVDWYRTWSESPAESSQQIAAQLREYSRRIDQWNQRRGRSSSELLAA